jgi:hypothetical protein
MKITIYNLIISLLFLASCRSEEEKFIQSELDKLKGVWVINNFTLENGTTEQMGLFKTGGIQFFSCTYNSKNSTAFKAGVTGCSSDIQIGNLLYSFSYTYDYDKKVYKGFRIAATQEMYINNSKYIKDGNNVISQSLDGDYEIAVVGDKMTAKQVKNTAGTNIQISFNATRQP